MTVALVVVVLLLLGVTVWWLTRSRTPALPPEEPSARLPQEHAPTAARPVATRDAEKSAPDEPAAPATAEPVAPAQAPGSSEAAAAEPAPGAPHDAAAEPAPEAAPAAEEAARPSIAAHAQAVEVVRKGLASTRGGFISRLAKLFGNHPSIDPALLEEIEEVLITADIGVRMTDRILETLRAKLREGQLKDESAVWTCLRQEAEAILEVGQQPIRLANRPAVILVVGVNGVGKTTTIGKLASRYVSEGKKVLLAAGDTYRAAAVLQLEMWGKRVGCPVVKGKENADPSAVIFEAVKRATDEGFDLVIADTAGRLHTKAPLMDEIKKVERTIAKATNGRDADEVFLVLDSTTGQNAVQQMNLFREAVGVTGVVLTKLDGTAKGGVILGIVGQHRVPVRFIGLGERVEDLREFESKTFVEALFARPDDETMAA